MANIAGLFERGTDGLCWALRMGSLRPQPSVWLCSTSVDQMIPNVLRSTASASFLLTAPAAGLDSVTQTPPDAARLRVEVDGGGAEIFIDGNRVGEGKYTGSIEPGRHRLRIVREGYDSHERELVLAAGEMRSESIALAPSVGSVSVAVDTGMPPALDGLYGGVHFLAAFEPGGAGTTFENACDSIGATSCSAGNVTAGGMSGYVGYMLEPVGFELALIGSSDFSGPSASFDGSNGSDINPVVAAPAREERFTIARFGGGAALRVRLATKMSRFGFSFALGPGLVYRVFVLRRDTEAGVRSGFYSDVGASYVSAMLSFEAAASFELGGSTALAVGVASWFEHAGDDTTSRPEERSVLIADDGAPPVPHATPPYDLATGAQWFVGPFLGLSFGP